MNFTKIFKADLDSPRKELSGCGLGIVVSLIIFPAIYVVCVFTGGPSNPAVEGLVTNVTSV